MCCDSNIYIQRTFIINLFGSDIGLSSRPTTEANMTEYDIHEQLYEYTHSLTLVAWEIQIGGIFAFTCCCFLCIPTAQFLVLVLQNNIYYTLTNSPINFTFP